MNKRFFKLSVITSLFFILTSCKTIKYENQLFCFDTICNYSFVSNEENGKNIELYIDKMNKLCDSFNEYNNITNVYTINNSDDFVLVDSNLFDIIKVSLEIKDKTNGYFNPLIGGLSFLYKKYMEKNELPSEGEIKNELEIINNSKIILKDNKVKIEGGAKIDLGAIAKGYVLEQIYKKFEFKSKQFLFNFGTSSIILGLSDAYNDFNVHYNNICFKAKNCAISTSSIDEQLLNINGNKHTHIINPFSGKNLCNYQTVIIKGNIDESAFLDALSTSFMLMDIEEIKQYINNKNLGVILINNDEIISNLIGYEGASNEIKTL